MDKAAAGLVAEAVGMSQLMMVSRLEDNKTSSVRENGILANMTDFCIREFTGRLQTLRSWVSFHVGTNNKYASVRLLLVAAVGFAEHILSGVHVANKARRRCSSCLHLLCVSDN